MVPVLRQVIKWTRMELACSNPGPVNNAIELVIDCYLKCSTACPVFKIVEEHARTCISLPCQDVEYASRAVWLRINRPAATDGAPARNRGYHCRVPMRAVDESAICVQNTTKSWPIKRKGLRTCSGRRSIVTFGRLPVGVTRKGAWVGACRSTVQW
jgi:hypothetical protein